MKPFTLVIINEEKMEKLGGLLYDASKNRGINLYLNGSLGAGKTTLVRGFLREAGFHGKVKSPTYTLVEPYEFEFITLYHFDFYRLNSPDELEYMGIRDYFQANTFCLVEWPEKAQPHLPPCDLQINIDIQEQGRAVSIKANTQRGEDVLQRIEAT